MPEGVVCLSQSLSPCGGSHVFKTRSGWLRQQRHPGLCPCHICDVWQVDSWVVLSVLWCLSGFKWCRVSTGVKRDHVVVPVYVRGVVWCLFRRSKSSGRSKCAFVNFSAAFERPGLRFHPELGGNFIYLLVAATVHLGRRRIE